MNEKTIQPETSPDIAPQQSISQQTSEAEPALENPAAGYFSSTQWVIFGATLLIGLLYRWLLLDERPLHHDESLHVMYSKYIYDNPQWGYYKYDPMLHGPLLYNVGFLSFLSFGVNEWAGRFPVALMGSFYMLVPYFFRRFFSSTAVIILTCAIAFSPTLIYWSRFLREDFYVITPILITMYGLFLAPNPSKALWVLLGFSLHLCSKENIYVHIALVAGYFAYSMFVRWFLDKNIFNAFTKGIGYVLRYPYYTGFAALVSIFVFVALFSGGFQNFKYVWDILTGEPIRYWMNQHGIERIQGPFLFHFYVLSWYESVFMLMIFVHGWFFYKRANVFIKAAAAGVLLLSFIFFFSTQGESIEQIQKNLFFKFFKPKDALDVFAILIILLHPVFITTDHLLKRENKLAAAGYTFGSLFFTYSYLGEKVPWLSVYPLVGGLLYFGMYFDDYFKRFPIKDWKNYRLNTLMWVFGVILIVLSLIFFYQDNWKWADSKGNFTVLVVGLCLFVISFFDYVSNVMARVNLLVFFTVIGSLFMLRSAYLTNFVFAGEASEYLSQVHTTREIRDMALEVLSTIKGEKKGYKPDVYVDGDPVWPLTWYFRSIPENYKFQQNSSQEQRDNAYWKFLTWKENETTPPAGYRFQRLNLRGWWVPEFKQMTLKKFILYALNHQPWSGTGYSYATLFVKQD